MSISRLPVSGEIAEPLSTPAHGDRIDDRFLPPQEFRQSFALIDSEGRLVAWDRGLEIEWAIAGHLIRRGGSYAEIVRVLATGPGTEAFMKENFPGVDPEHQLQARIAGLGTERRHEYRTADGRTILVEERPIVSGGTQRIARDITAEKQVEGALAEARKRLDSVDSNEYGVLTETRRTPDGLYDFGRIGEPLCRLLDLPELVGQDPMLIFSRFERSADDNARSAELMERSARTLESFSEEYQIRDGKNRLRWIRQSMMPQREPDGTVVYSGVLRDVTREKEAEDQVEMLQSVVVRSSDSILIMETDPGQERDSKIVYVNQKFTELFGWSADELVGQPSDILTARPVIADTTLFGALERNDGELMEFETSSRNGRVFWVEARVATIQKFDSGRYRWAVMSHDISERRHAQDELLRAKEEAEAGNRAKGEFLANMSHELRTPLNAIIGFTELISQGVAKTGWTSAYSEYLDDVSESGHHLLDLINTVLDLSKIEAGQLELNLEAVDLGDVVRRSLAMVSGMARAGGITLSEDIPADPLEIQGDFRALKQVVLNVLSNAIKFTPPGGTVNASLSLAGADAAITVTDTGCGIAEEDLERVMLPFVQVAGSISRNFGGSGLGLTIAHDLCLLHRGSLRVVSSIGRGTTIEILLPLTAAV